MTVDAYTVDSVISPRAATDLCRILHKVIYNPQHARSQQYTQLAKMGFDEILYLTA